MLPLNEWVFLCIGIRGSTNMQYGFRYHLKNDQTSTIFFKQQNPSGTLYTIDPSSEISLGGDLYAGLCYCTLQYVRFYIDYVPDSQDQMINIALNSEDSTLFLLHFAADTNTDDNQTAIVTYIQGTNKYSATATRGSSLSNLVQDPEFGPYNVLHCRPNTVLSYSQIIPATNGFIVFFDFKPDSGQSNPHNIFSIRDSATNFVSMIVLFDPATSKISIKTQSTSNVWTTIATSTALVFQGNWNKIVIELVQAQPIDFGSGYFSARIWINHEGMDRVYFGDVSLQNTLFSGLSSFTLDLCGTRVSGSTILDSTLYGSYDINNFQWLNGVQGVIENNSDLNCVLGAYYNTEGVPAFCLHCAFQKYLQDNVCVPSCSSNYFHSSATYSCQSCYYGKYHVGNGICTNCTNDGESLVGSTCILCASSCKKCTGDLETQCTSCYEGTYLYRENNTCLTCNANGYFIDSSDKECKKCNENCKTCDGTTSQDCLSCPAGATLFERTCLFQSKIIDPKKVLDSKTYQAISTASDATSATLKIQSASTSLLTIIAQGATTTAVLLVDFMGDVSVFRFINVAFPANFVAFCQMLDSNFLPNLYNGLAEELEVPDSSTGKFLQYEVSTASLCNLGDSLNREAIVLVVVVILPIVLHLSKKYPRIRKSALKLNENLRWNTFLTFYIGDAAELVLYCLIQVKEGISSPTHFERFSLVTSIMILASFPILIAYFYYLLNIRKKLGEILPSSPTSDTSKRESQALTEKLWIPPSVGMIINDLDLRFWFTKNFLLIRMVEDFIIIFIIVFLQDYGLAQAIIYFVIILIMFVLGVIIYQPFENRVSKYLFIMDSSTKLILSFLALLIGINESTNTISSGGIDVFGIIMIALVIVVFVVSGIVAVGTLILSIKEEWKKFKESKKRKSQISPMESLKLAKSLSISPSPSDSRAVSESGSKQDLAMSGGLSLQIIDSFKKQAPEPSLTGRFALKRVEISDHSPEINITPLRSRTFATSTIDPSHPLKSSKSLFLEKQQTKPTETSPCGGVIQSKSPSVNEVDPFIENLEELERSQK